MSALFTYHKDIIKAYGNSATLHDTFKKAIIDENFINHSPKYYLFYPKLFSQYFCAIDAVIIDKLCLAGYLYYLSSLYLDSVIDENNFKNMLYSQVCQEEAIKLLGELFPRDSNFWKYWQDRKIEFFSAVKLEKDQSAFNFPLASYEKIAAFKSAFGKIAIDALHVLSGEKDKAVHELLLKSHDLFSIGFQITDDILDLRKDNKSQQMNYGLDKIVKSLNIPPSDMAFKLFFVKNLASACYNDATGYFTNAKKTLASSTKVKNTLWLSTIDDSINNNHHHIQTITAHLKIETLKIRLKKNPIIDEFHTCEQQPISKADALNFAIIDKIMEDKRHNFVNLKHYMYLSAADGFTMKNDGIHSGDIFQRAMLTNLVHEISGKTGYNLSKIIESEICYLLNNSDDTPLKGWKYFPTVEELAPDIDDLAEILRLLFVTNKMDTINEYTEKCLEVMLQDCLTGEYNMPKTWIIPKNKSILQEKQEKMNKSKWGEGPDCEVVANLLYTLALIDRNKHHNIIKNGLLYIKHQFNVNGFWQSRWYYGNYYGTYVCCRFLKEMGISTEFSKVYSYLEQHQNQDGGWHWKDEKESEVLSTSIAVMILKIININDNKIIEKATKFLRINWEKSEKLEIPFIMPKVGEPYSSSTLTLGFLLKALN